MPWPRPRATKSVVGGRGVGRFFAYQFAEQLRQGKLEAVLASDENSPMPVHMISPQGRLSVPKVRALLDFAVPKLRSQFARLAKEAGTSVQATRS
jgi:DNA-binding transcriptional LysR family regulator